MKLSYFIFILFLTAACQKQPKELIGIKILTDKETFNPLLEPGVTGNVSVLGIYSNRRNEKINDGEIILKARRKLASGDVEVIQLEGNKIIPKEGGMGTIEAVVVQDGKTFKAEKDIVVRPFYHDYHQMLVLKLWNQSQGEDKTPDCTFEETLDVIRKTDQITREIPKIIYLEGWERGGFDNLCPAWNEVNPKLKRVEDETALESLRWLIR